MTSDSSQSSASPETALRIWRAGVDAVRAETLVDKEICLAEGELIVCGTPYSLAHVRRVCVVGAGKAAGFLAKAIEKRWEQSKELPELIGHVNVPENCVIETERIVLHAGRPAGVNEPRAEGVAGARKILEYVGSLDHEDLCICLITGGGSALLPLPAEGISLEDKLQVTRIMSANGASIQELNQVRIALSGIKGGRLARSCSAGRLLTLIVSDVIGDPLDLIASGPTIAPSDLASDASSEGVARPAKILLRYTDQPNVPSHVWRHLDAYRHNVETPQTSVDNHLLANNAYAVRAACEEAEKRGYEVVTFTPESPQTTAEEVAEQLIPNLSKLDSDRRQCLIWGGEPIVRLAANEERGRGGRNQQLVLKAAQLWNQLSPGLANRLCILSGGTDGEDGPTDAAGAFLTQFVIDALEESGCVVEDYLRRNDAYTCFDAVDALIKTGPTHTNVCDLRVATIG